MDNLPPLKHSADQYESVLTEVVEALHLRNEARVAAERARRAFAALEPSAATAQLACALDWRTENLPYARTLLHDLIARALREDRS